MIKCGLDTFELSAIKKLWGWRISYWLELQFEIICGESVSMTDGIQKEFFCCIEYPISRVQLEGGWPGFSITTFEIVHLLFEKCPAHQLFLQIHFANEYTNAENFKGTLQPKCSKEKAICFGRGGSIMKYV